MIELHHLDAHHFVIEECSHLANSFTTKCGCIGLMVFRYLSCLGTIICDINTVGLVSRVNRPSDISQSFTSSVSIMSVVDPPPQQCTCFLAAYCEEGTVSETGFEPCEPCPVGTYPSDKIHCVPCTDDISSGWCPGKIYTPNLYFLVFPPFSLTK